LRDPRTLADRLGAWPERILALAGLLAVILALRVRRQQAPDRGPQPSEAPALLAGQA